MVSDFLCPLCREPLRPFQEIASFERKETVHLDCWLREQARARQNQSLMYGRSRASSCGESYRHSKTA